ncbi:DNA glycosylase [Auriscalpium vulgare]|uniref:DNA glycosylase n=1 Tax=Auriscalpium vulgare TaxID=40419 RepID=A0ACB8S7L2_9AGAM|nr:DNA glycosylase [Auriscalpium vulgare]
MPVTRSAARGDATPAPQVAPEPKTRSTKRKGPASARESPKKKRSTTSVDGKAKAKANEEDMTAPPPSIPDEQSEPLPAKLTFSFEEAKQHLINADSRFHDVFSRLPCKPYEKLESVEPFRGQQISWLAARSITHKFLRLYFPELPEKPDEHYWSKSAEAPFPTPHQVAATGLGLLRTAGLSGRKAEYVQDLAKRFADGRLTSEKLREASDEELYEMLTAVYGIGRVIDMFAIFSLRRPDILPAGDLGVQRGMLRWFLSLHHPPFKVDISPQKLPKDPNEEPAMPGTGTPASKTKAKAKVNGKSVKAEDDLESGVGVTPSILGLPSMPPLLTPSINSALEPKGEVPPLPEGLTVSVLKGRLDPKKKVKGAILTPKEMEALTEHWRPYRSLGVYYMWALAEEK